jgi:hypothetical protein
MCAVSALRTHRRHSVRSRNAKMWLGGSTRFRGAALTFAGTSRVASGGHEDRLLDRLEWNNRLPRSGPNGSTLARPHHPIPRRRCSEGKRTFRACSTRRCDNKFRAKMLASARRRSTQASVSTECSDHPCREKFTFCPPVGHQPMGNVPCFRRRSVRHEACTIEYPFRLFRGASWCHLGRGNLSWGDHSESSRDRSG